VAPTPGIPDSQTLHAQSGSFDMLNWSQELMQGASDVVHQVAEFHPHESITECPNLSPIHFLLILFIRQGIVQFVYAFGDCTFPSKILSDNGIDYRCTEKTILFFSTSKEKKGHRDRKRGGRLTSHTVHEGQNEQLNLRGA
jgi:hypothetical protein